MTQEPTGTGRAPSDAERVVRGYYAAIDANDLPAVFAMFADNIVYSRPGYPTLNGRAEFEAFYHGERIIASGAHTLDRVLAVGEDVATCGTFNGVSRDGADLHIGFAEFFRLTGGLVGERNTYFATPGV